MPNKNSDDIEILAIWMAGASLQMTDGFEKLRQLVSRAAANASFWYSKPNEDKALECGDEMKVRNIIGRFASALDEDMRDRNEDNAIN